MVWGLFEGDIHLLGVEEGTVFLIGTDKMGRDLLSRIIFGGRISLSVGLLGIAISFLIGVVMGGFSGYFGGVTDLIIQRIIEFLRSIPTLPLWMALSVALPPTWTVVQVYFGIVVILSLVGWTGLARVVRGKFMSLREEEYVMAAQLNGSNEVARHLQAHAALLHQPYYRFADTECSRYDPGGDRPELHRPRPTESGHQLGRAAQGRAADHCAGRLALATFAGAVYHRRHSLF